MHLIISFGNLTDYGTNFAFVQHVLSMDTIFPDSHVQYRAIHLPWMHHLFYSVIIALELLISYFFLKGTVALTRSLHKERLDFEAAKQPAFRGVAAGILLWLLIFSVVGAEWFSMWQSQQWNGVAAASRNLLLILITYVLLLIVH